MKIAISNNRKIYAIQEEFSHVFPELKIAFHAKPSHAGAAPSEKMVTHKSKTLQECRSVHNEGHIEILPTMSISDIQNNFRDIFGLSVEISQKAESGSRAISAEEK